MASFPEGWFLVKNLNNGYVLSVEKSAVGEPVVISSLRKDIDSQLWQYGEDCRLHNKKTGFVLDIAKGVAKAGSNVVLQNDTDLADGQTFGLTSDGLIHIVKNPNLVLGIKDSFFTRSEGQHVHLQLVHKNPKDRKEQRWELSVPSKRHSLTSHLSGSVSSLKRTISNASFGSSSSLHNILHNEEESHLDDSAQAQVDNFPEGEFFIKSELTGHFVSVEASALHSTGAKLCLEPLRTSSYESQLWHFDPVTHRLINKGTGFALTADDLTDEASVSQSSSLTEKELSHQAWSLGASGTLRLKQSPHFLLGFKKDNWFNLSRDQTALLLQKADARVHSYQKFVITLPIFRKTTAEIVSVTAQIGVFPEGHFFIKNQKHGLVVSVVETEKLAAQIVAAPLDAKNYNRQLWSHKGGFLTNKASGFVLDVRGGSISHGTELCQYKQKKVGYENQQWGLSVEGFIHTKKNELMVLALDQTLGPKPVLALAQKKTPDHEEQRWNFVLPVFKHKSNPVTEKTVQKSIVYHRFAQYPSGWFFIRSFSKEGLLVLTASEKNDSLSLTEISKEHWRYQLWMHWNGGLINFATQLALATSNLAVGANIRQDTRHVEESRQKWTLTTEGYFVHGSSPGLLLVPEGEQQKLTLIEQASVQHGHRWGLLTPETKVEHGLQILSGWKASLLSECKVKKVTKVVHRFADWPEDTFYISAQEGYALVPEKQQSYATLVVRKLEYGHYEQFQWSFREGYLVHVATGLVLHATDELVSGSELQIRERLTTSDTIDARQRWVVRTDGSIVSETKNTLGFALLQQNGQYHVQLAYPTTGEHYSWGFVHGHYETRYSNVYRKEMKVLTRLERILLTVRRYQIGSDKTKLVTRSYGVFPENWFYIRSRANRELVLTAPDKKRGSKLTVSKMDFKNFRRQLWHVEDEDCLKNLDTGYVIDVAGGCLEAGNDAIQWHQKFLKIQRKNQVWGLSVDGHIHPKSRPGLVLGPKGNTVNDGAEIQLHARGSLDLEYQRWTFAIPVFGRPGGLTSVGVLEGNDVFVDKTDETEIKTTQVERYERTEKITIVRRWGVFPQEGFFVRSNHADRLALTVEKKPRLDDKGREEYAVSMRPIDYKEYKWHFWTYQQGRLVNAQTGLALDASPLKGILVEDGLQSSLFVRQQSESTHQFWALSADGEIYLKADQRTVVGVSSPDRVAVAGAQVGIRTLRLQKSVNDKGQQITTLKSHPWLQWSFSKPVFGTRNATEEISSTLSTVTGGLVGSEQEIQGLEDTELKVEQAEASSEDYESSDSEDDQSEEEEDEEEEEEEGQEWVSDLGIATAGAAILNNTLETGNSEKTAIAETKQVSETKATKADAFHVTYDYVPNGYERVVRYVSHQQHLFPHEGYFMIKSYLHGYVLDVANNEARDGSYVVLAPIKTTNFASQLWSYRGGRLVNLKSHNLVLDASLNDTVVSGERVGLSTQKTAIDISDQHWEFDLESGVIHLAGKRSLVLSVKELNTADRVDLFIQEEKPHAQTKFARAEQRWEIKVPAFVPVEDKNNKLESNYTIIEAGKVSAISSTLSSVLAFEWLKSTFYHKMSVDNQWPSTENFFFVRIGNENAYLCAGTSVTQPVSLSAIQSGEDHKRYLWAFVDGYLVNYKYMLRLIFDTTHQTLILSSHTDSLNQTFSLTRQGALSVNIGAEVTHFEVLAEESNKRFRLNTRTEAITSSGQYPVQLHVPVFWNYQIEKETNVALSTITTWIRSSQKTSTTVVKSYRYGVFPKSWFYIKVDGQIEDSLVLASKGDSLVLDHLSFKDYKQQLWSFRDDALVSYGSKRVLDVSEGAIDQSLLSVSIESGLGTQKWSLTAEGHIYLDSYADTLSIGTDKIQKDAKLSLVQDLSKAIHWRFSVPVFGKKPGTTEAAGAGEDLMIETLKEVKIKVEEVFAKTDKQTANKPHHDAHDIMATAGIVAGGAIAGAAMIGTIGKIADKIGKTSEKHQAKKTTQPETSTVVIRRSKKTGVQIVQESQSIVRAWQIIFVRRIQRATTKTQWIEVIEESRQDLFRRLDEHLRVYTSVEHMVSGAMPDWHVSIEQVKELYRARVFERFLDRLHHEDIKSVQELDFEAVVHSASEEVDRHYSSVIAQQTQTVTEETQTDVHEQILMTVDTVKVRVRYWLVALYETIASAKENGQSEEEIHTLVQESRQQLVHELTEIKTTAVSHVEQSSLLTEKTSLVHTIEGAVEQAQTSVSQQVDVIATQKHYQVTETDWLEITRKSEEKLSVELKVYQTSITQEITRVQESKVSEKDQAKISVVLDEKMISVAQKTVTEKLLETKTKLSSWFTQVTEQISWVVDSSPSAQKDALAIADAAQVELTARIEETKLVLRTYYSHLTYLSWAERRRIEYSLDSIQASLVANVAHYKQSVQKTEITKEEISRFTRYSFGPTVSRTLLLDFENILTKIANVKHSVAVVNNTETKKAEINKIIAIGADQKSDAKSKAESKAEAIQTKVDHINKDHQSKSDHVKVEADLTKVTQTETDKGKSTLVQETKSQVEQKKPESKSHLAAAGAAASALAAVIYQHHENKPVDTKPADNKPVENKPVESVQKTQKQQKADNLVVVYEEVNHTLQEWVTKLNKRVVECVQTKSENVQEEIDQIVYESQQELVVTIEKAKRTTTSVIGTSQTSFHQTLGWIRGTIWKVTSDVKKIAVEATNNNSDIHDLEQKLVSIKETTLTKVSTEIEKSKTSAIGLVDHSSSATIAVGKKFEGVDYTKTTHGEHVQQTKVSVGILIEDTRTTVQTTLNNLGVAIAERRKQGGDHLQADIEAIVQKSRQDITNYIQHAKTLFEKRTQHTDATQTQIEIVKETNAKVQVTLEQIQQSVLTQVSKVEEVSTLQVSEVEYTEKITSACQDAFKYVDAALVVSETIIGHHAEVVAESSSHTTQETTNVSLGLEYGLVVVSETTQTVSAHVTQLIERVQHQVIANKDSLEQDVKTSVTESTVEIDRVFDEAKSKIEYELSMVASHEKVQEEHLIAVIEEMRSETKKRVSQVHQVALSKQDTLSEKLLQIAEESRHDISSRFNRFKKSVVDKAHNVKDSVAPQKKPETTAPKVEDHKSKIDMAEKVLAGAAAVVATTTIAAEVAKKVSEHKEKVEKEKKQKEQTALIVEDIKTQYKQWLATLTETVTKQCKSSVSHEEIKTTIEKSKTEFLQVIQKTKENTLITEKHQKEVLVWVEQTTVTQATRIQEIVVQSSHAAVDVESRLEVLKISTVQEVESALEKIKLSTFKFVGTTVDQLKMKEVALLDVKSELSLVVHDARSSVVSFFETFTKSVIARVQQGGDSVSKDVSILVADARKQITVQIENVKNTATKKLSSLETKSSVISIATLSGIATAELISVLKKTEETLLERINHVHSTVWYIQKDQDVSQIVESITKIETETVTEVTEKIEKSHYGFITGVAHHDNHITQTEQVVHHDEHALKTSLTVQEIKVTVREWLRTLAEKVSVCSQKGQSSEEIQTVITEEKKHLFEYLDLSAKKISEKSKSEESIQALTVTLEKVKTTVTKSTTEIHNVGVEFSGKTTGYGGYSQMTSIINEHEHLISEALAVYETKTVAVKKPVQPKDEKPVEKPKDSRTVLTVEYLITTIHTWFEELMIEASEVAKHEHDVKEVTEQVTKVVNDAKEFINIELNTVSKKVIYSKSEEAQSLAMMIEWTRGMILQGAAQIQQVAINSAVAFNATGGLDQMRPLISATEAQVKVALERSSKTLKIEIERKSSHAEKYQIIQETRKQERIKLETEKALEIEKKKIESEKKAKLEKEKAEKKKIQMEKAKIEKARIQKERLEKAKLEKKEHIHEEDSDCSSDSDSDFDESDTEVQLKKAKKDVQKIIATGAVLSVSLVVREWYEKLIKDVSSRAKVGGSHSDSDIEAIVKKSTLVINEKLRLLAENAHITLSDSTAIQQYRQSIEWAKTQITQSTIQIQTIGINSATSAISKTGGIEEMRPIAVSIQQQIDVETQRYKLVSEKKSSAITKVESKPVNKIEHKENAEKVSTVKTAIIARKDYVGKLQENATLAISESKTAVFAWYSQVIRDVSIRVHQGGNNVKEDVAVIIEKSKSNLDEILQRTHKKFVTSVDVYEEDQSFTVVDAHIQSALKVVQKTAESKVFQVKEITIKYQSESEVTEKLSTVLETSKTQFSETFDHAQKGIVQVIEEEIVQRDSTVTIIETVEHVKVTVATWKTKLTEEIHAISIDQTIENKEERITQLIEEANQEVEKVTKEAKTKIDQSFTSVKNVSKSKQKELITTIDYVHETFATDVKKVQEVSIESLHKSESNVKDSVASILDSSRSKIDSFLTRTTAVVVGTATAAIAVHAIKKKQHEKEKIEKKEKKKTKDSKTNDNKVPTSAHENVKAITQWFELFTHRVSTSVRQQSGDVVKNITEVTEHAEQEINEIIKTARNDFVKRLSHENMDQEAYELTIKHYEESLESARVSIMTEVTEVKKITIESHKTGRLELLDVQLEKLVVESSERIKTAMESTVSITHETHSEGGSPVLNIEIEQSQEIIGDQEVDFERNEESIQLTHEEKVKKEKLAPSLGKIATGSAAIGVAAGAVIAHEKNKKDQVKQEQKKTETSTITLVKYETGVASIEAVHATISEWFKTLVQKVSVASKSGASSEQITVIVQESRIELTRFIEHVKTAGSAHCTSSTDEKQFISKIDWVSSVAYAQATQIQQIGINASVSKSDLTTQMTSLATASFHQIEVTLEQMKTSINFHQKINKISGKPKTQKVPKPSKAVTAVDKTKVAYSVIQETRVATVALLVSLTETIVVRIRRGGANVEEDVHRIVETAESEVTKIFEKSKKTSAEVDEKTRIQIENALTTVHKTVEEQITEVKTVTVKAVGSTTTNAENTVEKVLEVSKESKKKIESGFVSVSATITASLVTVNQTAQKATKTVQSWFSDLTDKINHLLEVSDCSAEETQTKINTVIAEAEIDMKKKITTIQQETTASQKNSSSEISTDHHLDVFFGNIKSTVESQLNDVKVAVQDKNKVNKFSLNEILQKTESKLKQEVNTHYDAVQQITNVDHITGTEQQVTAQVESNRHSVYKDTIEKVAVGTAAVVAAAAAAMEIHKKTQKAEKTSVEVVEESSIETVRTRINTWITVLTQRVVTRTKQGGQNVSADVSEIVKSAQDELETIISQAKSGYASQTVSVSSHTYSHTLEWIKTTAITQSTQITEIVSHSSTSSIDLVTQIENHVSVTKHQINSAFETHKKTEQSTAIVQSDDKIKLSTDETAVEVVSDQTKHENIIEVITETREQTRKRIALETTLIVQERKTEITNWLVLLMESITTIIHSHSQNIRADIFTRLDSAKKEVETYIEETKKRFLTINSSSVSNKVDVETQKLATASVKQSLDCIENIRTTLIVQITVVREVFSRIEVEDIDVITQRLHAIIDRAQQRVHHTFDAGIELAINSAFEGKVVTWTETATIPDSFKSVRTIAYDLAGTVIDYHKSLYEVWKKIVTPKNNIVLSTMDFKLFVNDWYGAFTEIKREHFNSKRPVSDDIVLHEALVHILKRFYVSDSFTQVETEELCESWRKVGTYEDASIGVRRIKNQKDTKYATIAISDTFSTRTMVDLAQSNCLCWHAQFSYDMFAHSPQTTASESLIQGTIQLLGLDRASELAIVTANTQLASAAKKHGCHAVLIEREQAEHSSAEYDIKTDGLDVFGESVQSFLEHKSMTQIWEDKQAPSAPVVWAQKVKSVFN